MKNYLKTAGRAYANAVSYIYRNLIDSLECSSEEYGHYAKRAIRRFLLQQGNESTLRRENRSLYTQVDSYEKFLEEAEIKNKQLERITKDYLNTMEGILELVEMLEKNTGKSITDGKSINPERVLAAVKSLERVISLGKRVTGSEDSLVSVIKSLEDTIPRYIGYDSRSEYDFKELSRLVDSFVNTKKWIFETSYLTQGSARIQTSSLFSVGTSLVVKLSQNLEFARAHYMKVDFSEEKFPENTIIPFIYSQIEVAKRVTSDSNQKYEIELKKGRRNASKTFIKKYEEIINMLTNKKYYPKNTLSSLPILLEKEGVIYTTASGKYNGLTSLIQTNDMIGPTNGNKTPMKLDHQRMDTVDQK